MTKAFFAGSFRPFTIGHASIVERALNIFPDGVVIAIGANAAKPESMAGAEERRAHMAKLYAGQPKVEVIVYTTLTVEAARAAGATVLLRGVRSVADFEYERNMAMLNRRICGIETLLMYALPELECVSSSAVRELQSYGADVSGMLPDLHKE